VRGQSAKDLKRKMRARTVTENGRGEGSLVRAEPLERAEEISQKMVDVVHIVDGTLLLDTDPSGPGRSTQ
jgi:hypothetical protein